MPAGGTMETALLMRPGQEIRSNMTWETLPAPGAADEGRLKAHVVQLATGERFNHDRHGEPLGYLDNTLSGLGLSVSGHTFTYEGRLGINLIARKEGAGALAPLLLCAHYDTVQGSPGADDNASGLAALLECARLLAPLSLGRTVDFVALDMEERQPEGEGLVGSRAFARDVAPARRYAGVYTLEMVGFTSGPGTQRMPPGFPLLFPSAYQRVAAGGFAGDALAVVTRRSDAALAQSLARAARHPLAGLEMVLLEIPEGAVLPPELFRSDHASFWAAGIPAVLLTDTADFRNPHYHSSGDTPDTLDYGFLAKVTATVALALLSEAAQAG
ncbi:MAG: M28 family peptidase [Chloroflexi bacterium]|nr:M28 family peptidase [Chloroflexota bacterium]